MKKYFSQFMFLSVTILSGCVGSVTNNYYKNNSETSVRNAFIKLPKGAVRPDGWLKYQLDDQADDNISNLFYVRPDSANPAQSPDLATCDFDTRFETSGDNKLADSLELVTFNGLAHTTATGILSHQYDHHILQEGWSKFVENMWMATNDNGLISVSYGPSEVKAVVGKGITVSIREETDYPFNGHIKLTIITEKPVRFPVYLRVPGWCGICKVSYRNKFCKGIAGQNIKLLSKWKDGDEIVIEIPFGVRVEACYNNSVSLFRGPLYYSLRIAGEYKKTKINNDNPVIKKLSDLVISPLGDWNYGILIDRQDPGKHLIVIMNPVGRYPFADRGDMIWSPESGRLIKWDHDAPVVIKTRGIKIPEWKMKNNSFDVLPLSPVKSDGDPEIISLIPYGCARLWITEFPVMDLVFMTEQKK